MGDRPRTWKKDEDARKKRARAIFLPEIRRDKSFPPGAELVVLNMGQARPHTYVRMYPSIKEIMAGRRVTYPWRRVS